MRLSFFLIALAVAGGCYVAYSSVAPPPGERFAVDLATARDRIEAARNHIIGTGLGPLTLESGGRAGDVLLVSITHRRDKTFTCGVTLSALAPRETNALVDCTQPQIADATARRLGDQLFGMIVREHVAAAIKERPFDTPRVANGVIAFAAMNGPLIVALGGANGGRHAAD